MIRFLVVMILLVSVGSTGFPQRPNPSPESPNRSETSNRIDKLFEQWNKPDSAGCALGVIKDGKIIFERGYGMADLEHNLRFTRDSKKQINGFFISNFAGGVRHLQFQKVH
jgi:CubicO group peptidase (beta-lactamase class C family)